MLMLFLTCKDDKQAEIISHILLAKKLVACVKRLPISSQFLWQGAIDNANEILLIMETIENKFDVIEQEVKKIHTYQTFVLTAIKVHKASKEADAWIKESLHDS
jgi:periplasmic divalent cation tolerance protein